MRKGVVSLAFGQNCLGLRASSSYISLRIPARIFTRARGCTLCRVGLNADGLSFTAAYLCHVCIERVLWMIICLWAIIQKYIHTHTHTHTHTGAVPVVPGIAPPVLCRRIGGLLHVQCSSIALLVRCRRIGVSRNSFVILHLPCVETRRLSVLSCPFPSPPVPAGVLDLPPSFCLSGST